MLCNENPSAGCVSADGYALHDPHQQEKQRRGHPDRLLSLEKSNEKRRNCHQQNAECEHAFAPPGITKMRHYDAANGPRKVTCSKDSKSLSLSNPIRQARGKKQLS